MNTNREAAPADDSLYAYTTRPVTMRKSDREGRLLDTRVAPTGTLVRVTRPRSNGRCTVHLLGGWDIAYEQVVRVADLDPA